VFAPAVDLHCHILPGLDDGARDLDDALALARQAEADGISAVCATPHIRHDHDVRIAELPERIVALRRAIADAAGRIQVVPGGEVAATALGGLDDRELSAVSLGGGRRWVLLEPAPGPLDDGLEQAVAELSARGFRAIVAHPERHLAEDLIPRLQRVTAAGALVQATAASLTEAASREGMAQLAAAGVIHVLGSDAHSSRFGRPAVLSGALAALAAVAQTERHLAWIAERAPRAIIAGEDIRAPY
jgi:protein-tyrosine phosphatase